MSIGAGQWREGGVFIVGIRFLLHFSVFAFFEIGFELFDEAVVGAADAGLMAAEGSEGARVLVEGAVSQGAAGFGVADRVLLGDLGLLLFNFEIDHGGLDAGDAEKTPADGHEFVEEIPVDEGFGLELDDVTLAEGAEILLGLVSEDGAARIEAVGDGGGVRTGAALGGFGTVREGAIGAGRIDSTS
jgi:hypothetical protein